jgi:hypothetical protein
MFVFHTSLLDFPPKPNHSSCVMGNGKWEDERGANQKQSTAKPSLGKTTEAIAWKPPTKNLHNHNSHINADVIGLHLYITETC